VPLAVRTALPQVDESAYLRAQQYASAKNSFGFFSDLYLLLCEVALLFAAPAVWNGPALNMTVNGLGLTPAHELARMWCSLLLMSPLEILIKLPVSSYRTFVIEEEFGFNKQTLASWISDTLKQWLVDTLLSVVLMAAMVILMRNLGDGAWFILWVFTTVFCLAINMAWPILIAPLFNTFKRLESGMVRTGVEALVTRCGLRADRIFEVDGSRQSAHSNAYVSGFFGTKRVVIYDTLLTHLDAAGGDDKIRPEAVDAVCAVVAHEIGHAALHHNWVLLGVMGAQFLVLFCTFGLCQSDTRMVLDFGYDEVCTYLAIVVFFQLYNQAILPPFTMLLNMLTRQLEYAADAYSVSLGYDIAVPLAKMCTTNLENLDPDPLDSLLNLSHPTTVQRVTTVRHLIGERDRLKKIS